MNEIIFTVQTLCVMAFGLGALRLGAAALTTWIALQAVLANLFVVKQVDLFGWHVTCSDAFAIGSIIGLNLLREYYGPLAAKRALWASFGALLCFAAMAQLHLLYLPNEFDATHTAFATVLAPMLRLIFASLATFALVQQLDLRVFSRLPRALPFTIRNACSLTLSQWVDTALFSFLGLWGLVADLTAIFWVSFCVKLAVIALSSFLIPFSKRFVHADAQN